MSGNNPEKKIKNPPKKETEKKTDSKPTGISQAEFSLFRQSVDAREQAVTQADFKLFKQEMKTEYSLFTNNVSHQLDLYFSKIEKKIDEKLSAVWKLSAGVVTVFILAFWAYYEVKTHAVDQLQVDRIERMKELEAVNLKRVARMERLEEVIVATVGHRVGFQDKKSKDRKPQPADLRKTKKAKK